MTIIFYSLLQIKGRRIITIILVKIFCYFRFLWGALTFVKQCTWKRISGSYLCIINQSSDPSHGEKSWKRNVHSTQFSDDKNQFHHPPRSKITRCIGVWNITSKLEKCVDCYRHKLYTKYFAVVFAIYLQVDAIF